MKNDMNYFAIKTRIKGLIEEVQRKPRNRIDAVLEPIREEMLQARQQGVKLCDLFKALQANGAGVSASSFAKYAQRHLQVQKPRGKDRRKPKLDKLSAIGPAPTASIRLRPNEVSDKSQNSDAQTNFQDNRDHTRSETGKPRIAQGEY